ncbi:MULTISPECIES: response regulator transcription factor [Raineya]|jgi:two-component system alkaline phosphatase synthesis response regulator PhoP|uniref:Phosphate regulon transcriptional regulatory protein PhoB n=1 Tax=Raineya orbicola TaxID=2016530 RepID=A0A2N3IAU7_9BACT|nr:response regulator transcription factor [Raineya orbicola]PKQ67400.1 Response regulator [Raineya orbicola]
MAVKTLQRVLIADDDPDIVEMLQYNLKKEGYEVKTASNGKEAIEKALSFQPHLILMDIMMPQMDGIEASRIIKETPEIAETYIMFLTARSEEYSEIAAFDIGADDYIVKPIKPRALMSRIASVFRRENKKNKTDEVLEVNDLIIDKRSYTITQGENIFEMPRKEFELLFFLAQNPERVYSREELLQKIWGSDVYVLARTVDVHIRKLREKLGEGYIKTVKGVGYKFSLNE